MIVLANCVTIEAAASGKYHTQRRGTMRFFRKMAAYLLTLNIILGSVATVSASGDWKAAYRQVLAGYESTNGEFVLFAYRDEAIPVLIVGHRDEDSWGKFGYGKRGMYAYRQGEVVQLEGVQGSFNMQPLIVGDKIIAVDFATNDGGELFYILNDTEFNFVADQDPGAVDPNATYDNLGKFDYLPVTSQNIDAELAKWGSDTTAPPTQTQPTDTPAPEPTQQPATSLVPTHSPSEIGVYINGQLQSFEVQPQTIDDRTFLPLREIGESLGLTVGYDSATHTATLTKGSLTVVHVIGSTTITVNGTAQEFDVASTVIENRTLVPVRMLAEAIGADVQWEGATRTVTINTN